MRKFLKIILICFATVILLICGIAAFIQYELSDAKLTGNVQKFLAYELGTEVSVKGAKFHPFESEIAIYGLDIKDKAKVDMLSIDTLEATVNFRKLLDKEVVVYGFNLSGADATLYKETKTAPTNFQFVIDAMKFSGDKNKNKNSNGDKKHLCLDLRSVKIARTSVRWDVRDADSLNTADHKQLDLNHLWVHDLKMSLSLNAGGAPGLFVGKLDLLSVDEHNSQMAIMFKGVDFDGIKRKLDVGDLDLDYQDKHLCMKDLVLQGSLTDKSGVHHLSISNIYFENGIGVPRKERLPWRGKFDATHMRLEMSLEATANVLSADSIAMDIDKLQAKDNNSDLHIDNISMQIRGNHDEANVEDLSVRSGKTHIDISNVNVILPKYHKDKHPWAFRTSTVKIKACLQDIARPFAPTLKNFTTPLYATCTAHGNPHRIMLNDIHAYNKDRRLQAHAHGVILLPEKKGKKATLKFNDISLKANSGIKDQLIAHFPMKPKTMKFIRNLGDVTYRGTLILPFRQQYFNGTLGTRYGSFDVNLHMSTVTRYMDGSISTSKFHLGDYIGNPHIGDVSVMAYVNMDIASKRVARYIHRKQGKIPTGTLSGRAIEASYRGIKIKNIDFSMQGKGNGASGTLSATNKLLELSCDFSFTDVADIKNTLKVKPHIKLRKLNLFGKKDKADKKDETDKQEKKDKKAKDKSKAAK